MPAIREYKINTPFFFGQSMYSDVAPDNASWLVSNGQYNAKTVYPDYYDWLLGLYNNPTESNVVKVGSVTDNNGVLNGFSTSSAAIIPSFRPRSYIWEQHWKITTGSDVTSNQSWSGEGKTHDYSKPAIGIENGNFLCFLSSTGTEWNIGSKVNNSTAIANKKYYVKYE